MFNAIKNKIKAYILKKATANKIIDIVEVRTQEIGLTSVKTETDIRIQNSFFLPITILSIKTDLLNRDGMKVGVMSYEKPTKIKGHSDEILTTISQISIITSLFQAISTLLSQHIKMQSVGVAQVKFLWWIVEIPVNDAFEIHPSKLKITKPETEEERQVRLEKEVVWKERYVVEREIRKAARKEKEAEWKEDMLKRRYKENYIPKAQRLQMKDEQLTVHDVPLIITNEAQEITEDVNIALDSDAITEMEAAEKEESIRKEDTDLKLD